jgi:hypothetical protein
VRLLSVLRRTERQSVQKRASTVPNSSAICSYNVNPDGSLTAVSISVPTLGSANCQDPVARIAQNRHRRPRRSSDAGRSSIGRVRQAPSEVPAFQQTGTIYQRLLNATDVATVYADSPAMIAPATDNQPFFNQHTRWSGIAWHTISDLFHQGKMGRMALEDRPVAEVKVVRHARGFGSSSRRCSCCSPSQPG